jgi:CheY-like chemotaxis protein
MKTTEATTAAKPATPTATILLVEDNIIFRTGIAAYLKRAGYNVVVADNGLVALELLPHPVPALILLDIAMPVMDGHTFLQQLRSREAIARTPVLMMTAMSEQDAAARCEKLGIAGFLLKSRFSLAELAEKVKSLAPARACAAA